MNMDNKNEIWALAQQESQATEIVCDEATTQATVDIVCPDKLNGIVDEIKKKKEQKKIKPWS